MKIYISGKITGIEEQARELFSKAENDIREAGHEPVNPMTLPHNHDKSWQSYMKEAIKAMCDCDAIYMLSNWEKSKGAIIERRIADYLGLEYYIILEEKECWNCKHDNPPCWDKEPCTSCTLCSKWRAKISKKKSNVMVTKHLVSFALTKPMSFVRIANSIIDIALFATACGIFANG